ncbi:MAG: protein kinase [Gemmatimonadales bacterium]
MTAPLVDQLFLGFQNAIAGRYALEREIGRGGMGIVYLASDVALDRPVAIKLLPPALAAIPGLRTRFLGEARTAARLSHPNVVPIFAVDEAGSFVYFVMAYVAGGTLGDQLRKRGTLPPPQAARILRDVAWALDYAHGMGIIHRDVKPDNILIEEGSSRTLVADFGIAARADSESPGEGEAISGTTGFMSPEQAAGGAIDGRSDLYALGVVGHLALSGRMPEPGASLSQLSPQAPRALVQVIERCLAPRRGDRWTAGREVADALDRTGGGDLPAPLRMWLTRGQELGLPMTVWTVLIAVPTLLDMFFPPNYVRSVATLLLPLFLASFPWVGYGVWRVYQARRLLAAGYRLADLQYALQIHASQRAEELFFQFGKGPSRLGRILRGLAFGGMVVCTAAVLLYSRYTDAIALEQIFKVAAWTGVGSAVLGLAIPGRDLSRDRILEQRQKFWQGRLGRWMLRVAGLGLRTVSAPERALDRPTELALGHAADLLYEALPPSTRRELEGLPETIAQLSARAAELRHRIEEMDGLRGEVPTRDGEARGALEDARALWKGQFTETVGALETLRLGLLRLHNGAGAVSALATDLAHARTRMEDLRRLLAAQAEVERLSPSTSPAEPAGPPSGRPSPGSSS